MEKVLAPAFPEYRVISATKLFMQLMPPIGVLTSMVYLYFLGWESLSIAIASCIFLLSLPIQGVLWLGYRSQQRLPLPTKLWYQQTYQIMREKGCQLETSHGTPRYKELANLLKVAFKELDKSFTRQWF
jgi:uncharacterized membrane protein YfbV (UPF0208 family)